MRQPRFKFGDVVVGRAFGGEPFKITSIRWSIKLETYLYACAKIGVFEYRENELELSDAIIVY